MSKWRVRGWGGGGVGGWGWGAGNAHLEVAIQQREADVTRFLASQGAARDGEEAVPWGVVNPAQVIPQPLWVLLNLQRHCGAELDAQGNLLGTHLVQDRPCIKTQNQLEFGC